MQIISNDEYKTIFFRGVTKCRQQLTPMNGAPGGSSLNGLQNGTYSAEMVPREMHMVSINWMVSKLPTF